MTIKAFYLLLSKQIRSKFGRVFLASGGIMIAVWAITLTNALSLSLNETIVKAINSQNLAREIQVNKTKDGVIRFDEAPTFVAMGLSEIAELGKIKGVRAVSPRDYLDFFVKTEQNKDFKCNEEFIKNQSVFTNQFIQNLNQAQPTTEDNQESLEKINQNCKSVTTFSNVFENFYETHRTNWIGSTKAPQRGEMVACFQCGSLNFAEYLGVSSPEEMLGKKVYIELASPPLMTKIGDQVSVIDINRIPRQKITQSATVEMVIVSVIDDRDSDSFTLTGGANNNFFIDFSYYLDAIKLTNPTVNLNEIGFLEVVIFLEDYTYIDSVLDTLKDKGYFATSIAKILINSVDTVLAIQRIVLFGFGMIILIASVFGIVAIMIISVLERRKEIGILKSMGARDGDIFNLFLAESSFLGLFGWLVGTGLFYLSSILISQSFRIFVLENEDWKTNLQNFNITSFTPVAPWWLLISTLAVSLFFTLISGIYPAIKAARQNPVDVLRSE